MVDSSTEASRTVTPVSELDAEKGVKAPATARFEKGNRTTIQTIGVDDVFATDIEGEPDYRAVSWPAAFVLLLKSQVG